MSSLQFYAAIAIFLATYAVIAFSKIPRLHLDRPGAAICGAVLMVACGVLSFDEAWQAIDSHTITLLLGMMILNALLEESGFFELAAEFVLDRASSPVALLAGLSVLSGVLSALFLNDTVCLMLTVPVLAIVRHSRLRAAPYLIALAMSANIGSVMTVVGNPQNMLIAGYSDWTYARFFFWMAPSGIVGTAIMAGVLAWLYRGELQLQTGNDAPQDHRPSIEPQVDRVLLAKSLLVLGGVLMAFILVGDLSLMALVGAVTLLIISRRPTAEVLARVDWVLLAFFAGLFVVVRGLEQTGVVKDVAGTLQPMYGETLATQIPVFTTATVIGSNLVSNVPLVVLAKSIVPQLIEPELMWLVLAMASTLAGNLTIPGSVATLIVLETAKRAPTGRETIGFFEFLRVGIPVTLLTTTAGAILLAVEHMVFAR